MTFLKIIGVLFILVGAFVAFSGFASMVSDIQMTIGLVGINMTGIGLGLVGISSLPRRV